jgi:aminomethyltransferase
MVDFSGWEMPLAYATVREEQRAVRAAAGVFDVSHMGRFEVRGGDPATFLQRMVTNDVAGLRPGESRYTLMCRPDGGILDDLVVCHTPDSWMVVVNAATRLKDLDWLREHAPAGTDVVDRSAELGLIALQGPEAERMLPAEGVDKSAIPYFGCARGVVAGAPVLISRTGYTGEDGFEVFVPESSTGRVWDALLEAGAAPCGLACRDVCRLEAGLRLYGTDMNEGANPYEAGLGWTVKLGKGEFEGREALIRARETGPRRRLVGIATEGRAIPRHGAGLNRDAEPVGAVTSGTYSFWLGTGIGLASIERVGVRPGDGLGFEARHGEGRAAVVALPFYRGSVRKA